MLEAVMAVQVQRVPDEQRLSFLPKHFRAHFQKVEQFAYNWMSQLSADYSGGYWHYYEASNGAAFMTPADPPRLHLSCDNGFEGTMSANAAGIVASMYAINALCFFEGPEQERIIELYYRLRDVAKEHPEAALIFAAID